MIISYNTISTELPLQQILCTVRDHWTELPPREMLCTVRDHWTELPLHEILCSLQYEITEPSYHHGRCCVQYEITEPSYHYGRFCVQYEITAIGEKCSKSKVNAAICVAHRHKYASNALPLHVSWCWYPLASPFSLAISEHCKTMDTGWCVMPYACFLPQLSPGTHSSMHRGQAQAE